ncbi:MAG: glycosyltransferase family 4 protein [Pseudomonadales bacterium]
MRILFVDEELPWPLTSGKRIRTYHLVQALAKFHHIGYVFYHSGPGESPSELPGVTNIDLYPVAGRSTARLARYLHGVENLFSSLPFSVSSHHTQRYQQRVTELIDVFEPNVIVVEWTPYAQFVQNLGGIPVVLATHNVEARILRRHAEVKSGVAARYFAIQANRMEKFERAALADARAYTAVSSSDAAELESFETSTPGVVIDNGVNLDTFQAGYYSSGPPLKLSFVGSMDWMPNIDAVSYFLEEIWPLVTEARADAEFVVIGRNPPSKILDAVARLERVTATGTVDDVRPHVQGTTVNVVPLRVGGGSRLKILEALACGLPVVTTTVGLEGLELQDRQDVWVADSAKEFAEAVLQIAENVQLATELATSGRRSVEARYGWDAIGARYRKFLETLPQTNEQSNVANGRAVP